MKERWSMHFQRRWQKSIKLVRPNCTVKLPYMVLVPEKKPFYRFLYRGQHLRFHFRKSPNRKWDVAGFGLWGQTHERDKFQQPKKTVLGSWGHAAEPRWTPLPPAVCSFFECLASQHPSPQNHCSLHNPRSSPRHGNLHTLHKAGTNWRVAHGHLWEKTTPNLMWTGKSLFWQAWERGCRWTQGWSSLTSALAASVMTLEKTSC